MRGSEGLLIGLLLMALLLYPACVPQEAAIPPLVRLHVQANSDAPADQALKYRVRDAVLSASKEELLQVETLPEAEQILNRLWPKLQEAAMLAVHSSGFNYPLRMELKESVFPTRRYGDRLYRAGRYNALSILIGDASGQNWWCVLFPPLCFVELSGQPAQPGAIASDSPPFLRSRLLEWWRQSSIRQIFKNSRRGTPGTAPFVPRRSPTA